MRGRDRKRRTKGEEAEILKKRVREGQGGARRGEGRGREG